MRIFLIPLSTRRTFLYAQRLPSTAASSSQAADASYVDRVAGWAARKWSEWEKKESGWQKKVVEYGNHAFRRIPHEEWGLKSVPPLRRPKGEDGAHGGSSSATAKVELVFPPSVLRQADLVPVLSRLGTEREGLHRKKLVWCFVGMPVTAPFALVPMYVFFSYESSSTVLCCAVLCGLRSYSLRLVTSWAAIETSSSSSSLSAK